MTTFHQLEAACKARELKASIHQFDCGETVTIDNGVGQLFRITRECGEGDAVDTATNWLLLNNYIALKDIPISSGDVD